MRSVNELSKSVESLEHAVSLLNMVIERFPDRKNNKKIELYLKIVNLEMMFLKNVLENKYES